MEKVNCKNDKMANVRNFQKPGVHDIVVERIFWPYLLSVTPTNDQDSKGRIFEQKAAMLRKTTRTRIPRLDTRPSTNLNTFDDTRIESYTMSSVFEIVHAPPVVVVVVVGVGVGCQDSCSSRASLPWENL